MPQPFVVIVPHQLGKQAARDKLERRFNRIRTEVVAHTTSVDSSWSGDQLNFPVQAVGQKLLAR
jgi:prophage tail gpP-like protein